MSFKLLDLNFLCPECESDLSPDSSPHLSSRNDYSSLDSLFSATAYPSDILTAYETASLLLRDPQTDMSSFLRLDFTSAISNHLNDFIINIKTQPTLSTPRYILSCLGFIDALAPHQDACLALIIRNIASILFSLIQLASTKHTRLTRTWSLRALAAILTTAASISPQHVREAHDYGVTQITVELAASLPNASILHTSAIRILTAALEAGVCPEGILQTVCSTAQAVLPFARQPLALRPSCVAMFQDMVLRIKAVQPEVLATSPPDRAARELFGLLGLSSDRSGGSEHTFWWEREKVADTFMTVHTPNVPSLSAPPPRFGLSMSLGASRGLPPSPPCSLRCPLSLMCRPLCPLAVGDYTASEDDAPCLATGSLQCMEVEEPPYEEPPTPSAMSRGLVVGNSAMPF
eukprot:gnl/Dysnectes_brevis/443_a489_2735.p1 GENE.gnl/Dysnectes_brevis/443_a489_2735~~gnl/Dysnectes_brevis/443_a489_2735.p1  ORF type:complete len:405 (-),score=111.00 gnl/Dysnectes_brevis/443_a489_2735:126-1340(-)